MGKTIGKIVGAIFVGVAIWWLTEGLRGRDNGGGAAVPASIPSDTPPSPKYRMKVEPNINRNGGQERDFVANDFQDCLDTCLLENDCKAVTFNKSSRQCWVKTNVPLRSDDSTYDSAVKVAAE